jgi:5-formyltetrahydrofolate cyclo-ligase
MSTRSEIRKKNRAHRRNLSDKDRLIAARHVCRRIHRLRVFRSSKKIALYLPNDGELDLTPLIQHTWMMKKICYLPVLNTHTTDKLRFAPYHHDTCLQVNCYGIPEPDVSKRDLVRAYSLDLVLVPLVAFDSNGNRLGMGGGFYDRTLSYLRNRRHWHKPHIYGIAYDFQKVDTLMRQPWDIPMNGIVTDKHVYLSHKTSSTT